MTSRIHPRLAQPFWILTAIAFAVSQGYAQAPASGSAKTWSDRAGEIEEYLKSAEVVKMEDLSVGVTKPKKATLATGGLVEFMAWKPIKPGRYSGYYESYKSEIAAYELDKMLGLGMVPPTVEKRVKGELGAAVMWVSPTKSFKDLGGPPAPPPAKQSSWISAGSLARKTSRGRRAPRSPPGCDSSPGRRCSTT
jgi:hypothetical protein